MFKVSVTAAAIAVLFALSSHAYADSFRPGASPAGGRIGKYCNNDLLNDAEKKQCILRLKEAKTDDERREVLDTLKDTFKARQADLDKENERRMPGGKNGLACSGTQCQ
jgi:hypothetical protein